MMLRFSLDGDARDGGGVIDVGAAGPCDTDGAAATAAAFP
jgi:hypothetical protein